MQRFINIEKLGGSKILLLIIVIVLVVGGIFAWQYFVPKEEAKIPEEEMPGEITVDETADWKSYRNEKWGFEIKYPEGTKIVDADADSGWFFMQIPFTPNETKLVSKGFDIRVARSEWHYGVKTPASCVSDDNIGSVVINGMTFMKSDVSDAFAGMQGRAVATEYCTMKGDLAFKLVFRLGYNRYSQLPDFDQEKESIILNQIFSTFRFLE